MKNQMLKMLGVKSKVFAVVLTILVLLFVGGYYGATGKESGSTLLYGEIGKGDVHVIISSSGTLQALSTVEVGTQVSGKIQRILVDFNSEVKKGQLLAVLDTITLAAQVHDAEASLLKAKAEFRQKKAVLERNVELHKKAFLSELDYIQSQTDFELASASMSSAETALERAKINLGYAYIYAPISGRILNRAIEQGQTVAANFSAPTLFSIAEDLSSMRIMTSVDESDIGQICEGQRVTFTVQSYSNKEFTGIVSQIRLNASIVSNVVNYTVVVLADNAEKLLLPGMTATVDFYVSSRNDVLTLPNAALRFKPTPQQVQQMFAITGSELPNLPASPPNGIKPPVTDKENGKALVWYIGTEGGLHACPITTGITDGKKTEIILAGALRKGSKIITGMVTESESNSSSNSNAMSTITGNNKQGFGPPSPPPF